MAIKHWKDLTDSERIERLATYVDVLQEQLQYIMKKTGCNNIPGYETFNIDYTPEFKDRMLGTYGIEE